MSYLQEKTACRTSLSLKGHWGKENGKVNP